jgi:hypothetical protein
LAKRGTFGYDKNQTILCRSRAERKCLKISSLYNVGNGLYRVFILQQKGNFLSSKRGLRKYFFRSLDGALSPEKRTLFSLAPIAPSGSAAPGVHTE